MWIYMPTDRSAHDWRCLSYYTEFEKQYSHIGIFIDRVLQTWMEQEPNSEDIIDDEDVYILVPYTYINQSNTYSRVLMILNFFSALNILKLLQLP